MIPVQHGLTPAEYLRFRDRYLPEHPKVIFVLQSPPKAGKYFYNPAYSAISPAEATAMLIR